MAGWGWSWWPIRTCAIFPPIHLSVTRVMCVRGPLSSWLQSVPRGSIVEICNVSIMRQSWETSRYFRPPVLSDGARSLFLLSQVPKKKKKETGPPSVAALVLLLWNAIQFRTSRRDQRTQQFSPTAHCKSVFSSGAAVRAQFGTHIWAILWSPCGLLTVVASI